MTYETTGISDDDSIQSTVRTTELQQWADCYQLLDDEDYDLMLRGDSTREWIKADFSTEARR